MCWAFSYIHAKLANLLLLFYLNFKIRKQNENKIGKLTKSILLNHTNNAEWLPALRHDFLVSQLQKLWIPHNPSNLYF